MNKQKSDMKLLDPIEEKRDDPIDLQDEPDETDLKEHSHLEDSVEETK